MLDFLLMDYFLEQFMWDFVSTFQHMILEESLWKEHRLMVMKDPVYY